MELESIQKVRAEARGHMKTWTFSDPNACAQLKVSGFNERRVLHKGSAVKLLYLSHRVPFPPNKGDKIRSFHEIRHFSKRHDIDLLSFCDDPKEVAYAEDLKQYCKNVTLMPLPRRRQQAQAFVSMLTGRPWTLGYFSHPQMWAAVRKRLGTPRYDAIFVFSSSMAPYVASVNEIPKVLDFVDSDASKWLQYARFNSAPASWLYAYEGKKLARFERQLVSAFDASVFVSAREAKFLRDVGHLDKLHFVQNGIDLDYFCWLASGGGLEDHRLHRRNGLFSKRGRGLIFCARSFPVCSFDVPRCAIHDCWEPAGGRCPASWGIAGCDGDRQCPGYSPLPGKIEGSGSSGTYLARDPEQDPGGSGRGPSRGDDIGRRAGTQFDL